MVGYDSGGLRKWKELVSFLQKTKQVGPSWETSFSQAKWNGVIISNFPRTSHLIHSSCRDRSGYDLERSDKPCHIYIIP